MSEYVSEKGVKNQNQGAGWKSRTKDGEEYIKGILKAEGKEIKFGIFRNKNKKNDKSPDYTFSIFTDKGKGAYTKPVTEQDSIW